MAWALNSAPHSSAQDNKDQDIVGSLLGFTASKPIPSAWVQAPTVVGGVIERARERECVCVCVCECVYMRVRFD